jgi:hypothetical protein
MDKATFLEKMDQYIDGTMSSAEKYDFEQMLKRDPLLQEKFDIHKSIRKGIKISARKDLLSELNDIKKEINPNENVKSLFPRWILMVAAVFVSLLGVVFFFRNQSGNQDSKDLNSGKNYAGKIELRTLPLEGKLGGPSTESIHLILVDNNSETYEIKNDTLYIFTNQEYFDEIERLKPMVTLNQERNIVFETKEQTFIFKKKSD